MGAFDKLFNILGFEDKEKKSKRVEEKPTDSSSNFNLHEKLSDRIDSLITSNFNADPNNKFLILKPKDLKGVQEVIDHFQDSNCIQLDTSAIPEADKDRLLDFLSGALYALKMNIIKTNDDTFIITKSDFPIYRQK